MLDLGKLKIGIEVDSKDAKSQLNEFAGDIDQHSEGLKGKLSSVAGRLKTAFIAASAAAAAAVGAAVIKISKDALKAYSEFEQLEGGVKKIFGEDTAKVVGENAQNAFKTAGISANQYMEQITSFSASLLQSLGGDTAKAAEVGDMAIQDMADNANTFGTSMDAIQNAYQGFAKQNYTMLDNLKLGYGGTKQEMERLLADAEELTGMKYDINNLSDVYNAIHAVQEEMNVTGTTAREAMSTIEGSVNATKAAWQNFLVGLGDEDADMQKLVSNLLTSAGAALKNIVPRLGTIVKSLITTVINVAKNHATNGVDGVISSIVNTISKWPAKLLQMIGNILNSLADSLESEGSGEMSKAAVSVLGKIVSSVLKAMPNLIRGIIRLAVNLVQSGFNSLFSTATSALNKIKNSVVNIWNTIKKKIAEKLTPVINSQPIQTLITWVKNAISWWNSLIEKFKHPIKAVINTVRNGGGGNNVNGNYPPKRVGLKEVPYDNYKASLHKGEAVLTAAEANIWKKFIDGGLKVTDDEPKPQLQPQPINHYTFGDISVDVHELKDLTTVEEFIDMMIRAKQFA